MSRFTVITYFKQQNTNEDNAGHSSALKTATLRDAHPQQQLKCICCESLSNGRRGSLGVIFPGRSVYRLSAYPMGNKKPKFFRQFYRPVYASAALLKNSRAIALELDKFVCEMAIKLDSFTDILALITPARKHAEHYKLHVFEQRIFRHISVSTISEGELRLIQESRALKKYSVAFASVNINLIELVSKGDIYRQLTNELTGKPGRRDAYYTNGAVENGFKEVDQNVESQEDKILPIEENRKSEQLDEHRVFLVSRSLQLEEESVAEDQNDNKQIESQDVYWMFLKQRPLQLEGSASEKQHWDNESGDQDIHRQMKQDVHWEWLKNRVVHSEESESKDQDENMQLNNEDITWPQLQTELETLNETEAESKLIEQDANSVQIEWNDPHRVQLRSLDGIQLNNNGIETTVEKNVLQKLDKNAKMNCSRRRHLTRSQLRLKAELCKNMLKERAEKKFKMDIKRKQKQLDCQIGNWQNEVAQQLEQYVEEEYQKKHLPIHNQQQFDVLEYKKETEMLIIDNIDQFNKKDDQLKKLDVQKKETKLTEQDKKRLRLKHILNFNPLEAKKMQQQKEKNVQRNQLKKNVPCMKKTIQKDNFRNASWQSKENQMIKNPPPTFNRFREDTNLVMMKHKAQTEQHAKDNKVENVFKLNDNQSAQKRELQLQTKYESSRDMGWGQMKVQNSNIKVVARPVIQKEEENIVLNLYQLEQEIVQDLNELAASIVPNSEQQECELDVKDIQNKTVMDNEANEWKERKNTMMKILSEKRQKREAQKSKPKNIPYHQKPIKTKSTNLGSNSTKASPVRSQFELKADLSREMVTKRSEERLKLDIKRRLKQLDMQLKLQDVPRPQPCDKKDDHQKKCHVQTEDEKESMVKEEIPLQLQTKKVEVLKKQDVHREEEMHVLNFKQQNEHLVPRKAEKNSIIIKDELKKINKLQNHNKKTEDFKKKAVQDEQLKFLEEKKTRDQIVKEKTLHVRENQSAAVKNQDVRGDKQMINLNQAKNTVVRPKEHLIQTECQIKEVLNYEQQQEEVKLEDQHKPYEREQRKQKLFLLRNEREQYKKSQLGTKVPRGESELCKATSIKSQTKKMPKESPSKVKLNNELRNCQSWLTKDNQNEQELETVMATISQEAIIIPKVQNSKPCGVPKGVITETSAKNKDKKPRNHKRFPENGAEDKAIRTEEQVHEPSYSGSSLNATTPAVATNSSQALTNDSDSANSNHIISPSLIAEIRELLDKINLKEQPLMFDIMEFFHIAIQKDFKIYVRTEVKFPGSSNQILERCRLECFENNDGNKFIGSVALLQRQLKEMILMEPQLKGQLHYIDDAFNLTKMPKSITRGLKRICNTLNLQNVYNVMAELTYEFVQNDIEKLDEPEMS